MAHAYHDELGLPTTTVRPFNVYGPGRSAAARSARSSRRRSPARDLDIHGDGSQIRAWCYVDDMVEGCSAPRAPERGRPELQHRQRALGRDDLRPRAAGEAAHGLPRRDRLPAAPLHGRRAPHPERRQGARAARLRGAVELDEGLASGPSRGTGAGSRRCVSGSPAGRRARPSWRRSARCWRAGTTMGPKVAEFEALLAERARSSTPSSCRRARPRSTWPCSRSGSARGTRSSSPPTRSPRPANVVALAGARPCSSTSIRRRSTSTSAAVDDAVTPRTRSRARRAPVRPAARLGRADRAVPDVALVEDAAGALGRAPAARRAGALGVLGCLSFHPRKIVTTGEGGAVTTSDAALASGPLAPAPRLEPVRPLRRHAAAGFNYRLAGRPLRARIPQVAGSRSCWRRASASRPRTSGRLGRPRRDAVGGRGRPPRLAGVRRPARPPRRGARRPARAGHRGADRHVRAPPARRVSATRATSRARSRLRARARPALPHVADRGASSTASPRRSPPSLDRSRQVSEYSLPMDATSVRQTADERRVAVLDAATHEFAVKGVPRRLHRGHRSGGRHLVAVPLPALRLEEGALPRVVHALRGTTCTRASRGRRGQDRAGGAPGDGRGLHGVRAG